MADRVYLDWNATTPLRQEAKAAMAAAWELSGNPSSVHGEGRRARRLVEDARNAVANAVGGRPQDVVFLSGGTEANALADRVAVMNLGCIVEEADADELFAEPRHPYSRALLSAIPLPQPRARRAKAVLQGEIPSALNPPAGCRFHTRCPFVIARCCTEAPPLAADGAGHATACHRVDELPPADAILPAAAGFTPALAKLVAAFSRKTEGAAPSGVGIQSARPTTT